MLDRHFREIAKIILYGLLFKCKYFQKVQSIRTKLVPVKYTLNTDNTVKKPLLADKIAEAAANASNRATADTLDSSLVDNHNRNFSLFYNCSN